MIKLTDEEGTSGAASSLVSSSVAIYSTKTECCIFFKNKYTNHKIENYVNMQGTFAIIYTQSHLFVIISVHSVVKFVVISWKVKIQYSERNFF